MNKDYSDRYKKTSEPFPRIQQSSGITFHGNAPSIKRAVEEFERKFDQFPNLVNEMEFLHEKGLLYYDESMRNHDSYEHGEIYKREIFLTDQKNHFPIRWSISKAMRIIQRENIPRKYRAISQMNIDSKELDKDHLKIAVHNKKPGILASYAAWENSPYYHILIDGNHRAYSKLLSKGQSAEFPVFILDSEQTMEALYHASDRVFYLIHLLFSLGMNIKPDASNIQETKNFYIKYKLLCPEIKDEGFIIGETP